MTARTMALVLAAIAHARAKHGPRCIDQLPLHHRVSVLVEEVGEVARAVQEVDFNMRMGAGPSLDEARRDLRAELAQVAACALMWLEEELTHE